MHLASGGRTFPKYSFRSGFGNNECVLDYSRCTHQQDMLGTGDELFESKLKELDKLVGFGSMKRQKFDHCVRQYEKHANGVPMVK